jgi:hypothetical protein
LSLSIKLSWDNVSFFIISICSFSRLKIWFCFFFRSVCSFSISWQSFGKFKGRRGESWEKI